jgi:hypothetical protein
MERRIHYGAFFAGATGQSAAAAVRRTSARGMLHFLRDIPITGASTRDALKKDRAIGTLAADLWETPEVHRELPWAGRFGANTPGYAVCWASRADRAAFVLRWLFAIQECA